MAFHIIVAHVLALTESLPQESHAKYATRGNKF
jgi:hypothetical protein